MPPRSAFEFPITQGFGPGVAADGPGTFRGQRIPNMNKGFDYGATLGTPIPATTAGTVIQAHDSGDGWGISVKVRDPNGFVHNYGHMQAANVRVGQSIERGQVLGAVGYTGRTDPVGPDGAHLSYDVLNESTGEFVDPSPWVGGGSMNNYENMPDRGNNPVSFANMPNTGNNPNEFVNMQSGSDPLMQRIQALIQVITDPKAEPFAAAQAAQALDGLVAVWKLQNPYTPIDVAIKQAEMQRQYEQRQDQRTDSMYNAALGEFTAKGNAQQQNFQNELGLSDRRDQREYDIFGAQRQYGVDQQQLADAEFANRLLHFNALAGNSDRELNNAQAQVSRSLQGKNVGTQRANQIDQTTMQAAALAPPGGAEYVPGMEPGGLVATALRNIGATVPHDAFRFPDATRGQGFVNINPAQTLLDQDAALGVSGPIPEIPGFSPIAPPTPPNYGEMGITAQNPADLIAGIRGNAPPTPPNLDMSGYPQHPGYGPLTGPPSLAGLLSGGFNVNKPQNFFNPGQRSFSQNVPIPGPNGPVTVYPFMSHEFGPQMGSAYAQAVTPPQRPPAPPSGMNLPVLGNINPPSIPNIGGMNPMDLLGILSPGLGKASDILGLFGMGR
jgi:hypothetical protein